MPPKLTNEIINAAIDGFERQKSRIDVQIAELRAMLPGGSTGNAATTEPTGHRRRKISAAGRRAIAEAQRKRWAAIKGEAEAPVPQPTKPKRKLSAAAKAKLVANLKKARAAKAAKRKAAIGNRTSPHRKRVAVKKAALKAVPGRAAKRRSPARKAAKKKAVLAPVPTTGQAAD
jgi:hypothetical protein